MEVFEFIKSEKLNCGKVRKSFKYSVPSIKCCKAIMLISHFQKESIRMFVMAEDGTPIQRVEVSTLNEIITLREELFVSTCLFRGYIGDDSAELVVDFEKRILYVMSENEFIVDRLENMLRKK